MKLFLVGLVLVVVLFTLAVACPHLGGSGGQAEEEVWSKRLGRLFLGATPPLRPADIRWEDCPRADTLVVTSSCRGHVRVSDRPVRGASLRLVEGALAEVVVDPGAGSDALPGRITLVPGKPKPLRVFEKGATLTVKCLSATSGPCRVEIGPPGR